MIKTKLYKFFRNLIFIWKIIYKTNAINNCFDDLLDIKKLYLKMSNFILKFLFSTEYLHDM